MKPLLLVLALAAALLLGGCGDEDAGTSPVEAPSASDADQDDAPPRAFHLPAGWTEIEDGVWTRSGPESDPTYFVQQSARGLDTLAMVAELLDRFGASLTDLGDPIDSVERNGIEWDIFRVDADLALLIAGAEPEGRAYIVAVATTPDQIDELAETLLQPAVAAFTPEE